MSLSRWPLGRGNSVTMGPEVRPSFPSTEGRQDGGRQGGREVVGLSSCQHRHRVGSPCPRVPPSAPFLCLTRATTRDLSCSSVTSNSWTTQENPENKRDCGCDSCHWLMGKDSQREPSPVHRHTGLVSASELRPVCLGRRPRTAPASE